jgi:hypothetical protein
MAMYGYARVSTTDPDLTIQLDALKAAGCTIIRAEKVTGTTAAGREELATLLDGEEADNRSHRGYEAESAGPWRERDCQATGNWPGQRVSGHSADC